MDVNKLLQEKREAILQLAAEHGARNVRVFGSVVRHEADEQSDIDFLVDMEPGQSLLDLGGLLMDLRELLGREVDVVTEAGLYWLLRRRISETDSAVCAHEVKQCCGGIGRCWGWGCWC